MKRQVRLISSIRSLYLRPATIFTYMLQSTEYEVLPYLRWFWRTQDFSSIMHRRTLDMTQRALVLRAVLATVMLLQIAAGVALLLLNILQPNWDGAAAFGVALLVSYPVVGAHSIVLPLLIAKYFIVVPKNATAVTETEKIFAAHPGVKIAVLGSYGKTSMKELLTEILSRKLKVAATPGNKNVSVSHASFARQLNGDEDVLILEYGEGKPGDIANFARHTHPTHAVITGVAAAHMEAYKTISAAAADIFSIKDYVEAANIYVNAESPDASGNIQPKFHSYTSSGLADWAVSNVQISLSGTSFRLTHQNQTYDLQTGLLGRHQLGPLSAAVVIASNLGLGKDNIITGVARTKPYEHRLQPYMLGGAWIIDDTYNGNLEGVRAGTELLAGLPAERKWYVTPGLVEQGSESAQIHGQAGRYIARAKPDIVVLMQNSVTKHIQSGLIDAGFNGEIRLETDPLAFYTNLEQFVAAGDLVLMQNDWTDNYA